MSGTEDISVDPSTTIDVNSVIKSTYAHYIIFGCSIFAMAWAGWNTLQVSCTNPPAPHFRRVAPH